MSARSVRRCSSRSLRMRSCSAAACSRHRCPRRTCGSWLRCASASNAWRAGIDLRASVRDRVCAAIRARLPEGFPPLETVAQELRIPINVIHRELHFDGTSYTALVETARRDLAIFTCGSGSFRSPNIAFLLGYSELSAFSRAVRRWTGASRATSASSSFPIPLSDAIR